MNLLDLFVKIGLDDSDLQSGLEKVSGTISAAGAAITTAVGVAAAGATALVKESVSAYSNYEQLIGGVETLFSNLGGTVSAAPAVLEKANEAFKNANMSANQYMETVTSFSAALISSLEGDYDKAAQIADMAIVDMADNANKMGTSMESIQNAYQGFAKQNYTMLDNLKLGYGGTKSEMERLLKDAQALTGVKYDISNLSDVYEAIHAIQEQMGIAGATAREAETTIEGSFKTLSAAWENLVAGLANPEADLGTLMDNVVKSAETALSNLEPIVKTALHSLVTAIEEFTPVIIDKIPQLIDEFLPPLLDAATSIVEALVQALPGILNAIVDIVPDIINDIITTISDLLPDIVQAGIDMIVSLANGMSETLPDLIPVAVGAVLNIADTLIDNIDVLVDAAIQLMVSLADGFANAIPKLLEKIPELMIKLGTTLTENIDKIQHIPEDIIKAIADGLVHADWTETAEKMMDGLVASLDLAQKKVKLWIDNAREALTGESLYNGDINNVTTTEFVENFDKNKNIVVDAIDNATGSIRQAYDSYYGTAEEGTDEIIGYNEEALGKMADAQANAIENAGNTTADAITAVMAKRQQAGQTIIEDIEQDEKEMGEAIKAYFRDLENLMLENGYSEEWLLHQERAYIEVLDHNTDLYKEYNNKLLKEEQKLTKKVDTERAKQETERAKQLKSDLQEAFRDFEILAVDNGYTEDWLLSQEETYLETLDKSSDLYKEYHLKVAKQRKTLNDKIVKEEQEAADKLQKQREDNAKKSKQSFTSMVDDFIKNAQTKIKEYQKAVDDIKSKIKSFAEKLTDSFGSMFEFTKDEKTGKVSAKKTKDFLTDRIKMLEEYYNNIKKLKEKGISDTMLKELGTLGAEEGSAAAEYLLKMDDSELKRLGNIWNRYEETGEKVSGELYAKDLEEVTQKLDSERNTLLEELKELVGEKFDELLQNTALADLGGKDGGLKKWIDNMNSTVNDLNTKIESTFGQGFSVTIDGKQLVGAILPNINSGLGSVTRAGMRGAT